MLIDHASTNEYNENFEEVPIVFFCRVSRVMKIMLIRDSHQVLPLILSKFN